MHNVHSKTQCIVNLVCHTRPKHISKNIKR